MQWKLSLHSFLGTLLTIACLCMLTACATKTRQVVQVMEDEPELASDEVKMGVSFLGNAAQRKIRKVRSQSLPAGERKSFPAGNDILRVLMYDEEVITLPKMQASKDFAVTLQNAAPNETTRVIHGYSNVSYEKLKTTSGANVLLMDSFIVPVDDNGTLSDLFFRPVKSSGIFRAIKATVKPKKLKFKNVVRTHVIKESEHHYAIRFVGKDGMNILFEVRQLAGGSRPKVVSRKKVTVPMGTPLIEVGGHQFKVYTATVDFLDIERIS